MSVDGSSWSTITPDFVYFFQLREFHHVLRPADQKAAEHIVLARMAVTDIDTTRSILDERGDFLVAEKRQVMEQRIEDAEEALNRVIKLLSAARIEQVSEGSIRHNPKNAWVLQSDDAKSAATFGRLRTTHTLLKTVLHDLNNLEPESQFNSSGTKRGSRTPSRAPPTSELCVQPLQPAKPVQVGSPKGLELLQQPQTQPLERSQLLGVRPQTSEQPPSIDILLPVQPDPKHLLAWKMSRRGSRHTASSSNSTVSGTMVEEHEISKPRSPVSSQGNNLSGSTETPPQLARLNGNSMHLPEVVPDARLFTIHELETPHVTVGEQVPTLGAVEDYVSADISKVGPVRKANTMSSSRSRPPQDSPATLVGTVHTTPHRLHGTEEPTVSILASETEQESKRVEYADYRARTRKLRLDPKPNAALPNDLPDKSQHAQIRTDEQSDIKEVGQGRFGHQNSSSMNKPIDQYGISAQQSPWPKNYALASASSEGNPTKLVSQLAPSWSSKDELGTSHGAVMPSLTIQNEVIPSTGVQHISQFPSQTQWSATPQNKRAPSLHFGTSAKTFEIYQADPATLERVPTQLRVGKKETDEKVGNPIARAALPYPDSEAGSDGEQTDRISDMATFPRSQTAFRKSATVPQISRGSSTAITTPYSLLQSVTEEPMGTIERSVTAPPTSNKIFQSSPVLFRSANDHIHHRSFSDDVVPQLSVSRVPSIPRKPVPYRSSMFIDSKDAFRSEAALETHGVPWASRPLYSQSDAPQKVAGAQSSPVGSDISCNSEVKNKRLSHQPILTSGSLSDNPPRQSSVLNNIPEPFKASPMLSPSQQFQNVIKTDENPVSKSNNTTGPFHDQQLTKDLLTLRSLTNETSSPPSLVPSNAVLGLPNQQHRLNSYQQHQSQTTQVLNIPTYQSKFPNPLAMHPSNTGNKALRDSDPQPVATDSTWEPGPISQNAVPNHIPNNTGNQQDNRISSPGQHAQVQEPPMPLAEPKMNRIASEIETRPLPNRSRTVPEPVASAVQMSDQGLDHPRRTSEQGLAQMLHQSKPTQQDTQEHLGGPQASRFVQDQIFLPRFAQEQRQQDANQNANDPRLAAASTQPSSHPGYAADSSAIQNHDNHTIVSSTQSPAGPRKRSSDRELFGQHVWSQPPTQLSPQLYQTGSTPHGYFPGQPHPNYFQPQQVGFTRQSWQQLPVSHLQQQYPVQMVGPMQYAYQPQASSNPQQMPQLPYQSQPQPQPQPQYQPSNRASMPVSMPPQSLYQTQQQATQYSVQLDHPIQQYPSPQYQTGTRTPYASHAPEPPAARDQSQAPPQLQFLPSHGYHQPSMPLVPPTQSQAQLQPLYQQQTPPLLTTTTKQSPGADMNQQHQSPNQPGSETFRQQSQQLNSSPQTPQKSSSTPMNRADGLTAAEQQFMQQNAKTPPQHVKTQSLSSITSKPPLDPRYQNSRLPAVYEGQPQKGVIDQPRDRGGIVNRMQPVPTMGVKSDEVRSGVMAKKRSSWLMHQAAKMKKG